MLCWHPRTSVLLAMLGLVCAGMAAALIIHQATSVTMLVEVMEQEDTVIHQLEALPVLSFEAPTWLRHRRLMQTDVIPSPTPSPTTAPTKAPTYIITYDELPPKDDQTFQSESGDGGNSGGSNGTTVAATLVVGMASSIIVCSLLLYASDIRDRYRHEKWMEEQHRHANEQLADDGSSQKSTRIHRDGGDAHSLSMTSAGSSDAESGFWVRVNNHQALVEYKGGNNNNDEDEPRNMLPPMLADLEAYHRNNANGDVELKQLGPPPLATDNDDVSISRVSTLTTSLVEGGNWSSYAAEIEEQMSQYAIESSSDVTELSDNNRVSHDTALATLIHNPEDDDKHDVSVCSSLTNGSNTTISTPNLLGIQCLDHKDHVVTPAAAGDNGTSSLEVSPDTPQVKEEEEQGKEASQRASARREEALEFAQLEQLIAGIPFDEMSEGRPPSPGKDDDDDDDKPDGDSMKSSVEAFVRDVYFVPCTITDGSLSLGLDLDDAVSPQSHVSVASMDASSPLVGRIFVGDFILKVNDIDAVGLKNREVLQLLEGTHAMVEGMETSLAASKMTKLTVMSSESDGGSLSDGQQSIDLGEPESGVEV